MTSFLLWLIFFLYFYVTLLISTNIFWMHQLHWIQKSWNIHQKAIHDVISGKWRILETFENQAFHYVSSVSLNLIWILWENLLQNVALKIRSITVPTYLRCVMLLGKYSNRCRNLWRSTKYDRVLVHP